MSVEWSGLGPELLLRLDRKRASRSAPSSGGSSARRSGRAGWRPGERLPSSRELARELGVSRGLVLECYVQLRAEGYLSARSGSATRVAARRPRRRPTPSCRAGALAERSRVDFRPGIPDLAGFPRRDWLWALREAMRSAPADAFGYGDPRGSRELRTVLAAYLRPRPRRRTPTPTGS